MAAGRAQITVGWDGRKQIRQDIYGRSRAEVRDRLDEVKASVKAGTYEVGKVATLENFLTRWIEHKKVGATTRIAYRQKIVRHVVPTLGRIRLDRLTVQHVNELLDEKAKILSAQSVAHIRAVLRDALNDAVRWSEVGRNVAALSDAPRVEQYEAAFLSAAQARAFISAADNDRLAALYRVAIPLGLRQGEALGLR